jgi:hypothetical protein
MFSTFICDRYSWYQHQVRKGDAPASFREAVEPEVRAVVECAGSSVSAALRDSGGSVDEIEHIMECIEQAKATMQKDSGQRPKNYIFDSLCVENISRMPPLRCANPMTQNRGATNPPDVSQLRNLHIFQVCGALRSMEAAVRRSTACSLVR